MTRYIFINDGGMRLAVAIVEQCNKDLRSKRVSLHDRETAAETLAYLRGEIDETTPGYSCSDSGMGDGLRNRHPDHNIIDTIEVKT